MSGGRLGLPTAFRATIPLRQPRARGAQPIPRADLRARTWVQ